MAKKNPHAVALGKLGGSKGGKKRMKMMTPAELREHQRRAVLSRWAKWRKRKKLAKGNGAS